MMAGIRTLSFPLSLERVGFHQSGRVESVGWGGGVAFQFREGTCETSTNCFLVTRQWPTTMEHGLGTDYIISINTSVSTPITPLEILS